MLCPSTPSSSKRGYVSKTPQPLFPRGQWNAETPHPPASSSDASLEDIEAGRIGGPAYEEFQIDNSPAAPPAVHVPGTTLPLPALANGHANGSAAPHLNGDANGAPPAAPRRKSFTRSGRPDAPVPRGRFPPTTAPLLPPHRWCARCAIVKPYRAHHCRICGTCVLKFDHHCPCELPTLYSVSSSYSRSLLPFPPSFRVLSPPFQSSALLLLPVALPSSTSPPSSLLPLSPALPSSATFPLSFGARLPLYSPAPSLVHMPSSPAFGVRRPSDACSSPPRYQFSCAWGALSLRHGAELATGSTEAYHAQSEASVGVEEASESASENEAIADAGSEPAPVRRSQRMRDRAGGCERV
ncbi:hypothetical protein DFH09DRAFT_1148109 [Mycena vulgaris]|nr:hypothetical protein DFH09DRAFT_1148109 [Mycena vulgaris]